ncbi:MAG: hypothetical protein NT038_08390 [Euryarchaeota archaeon]|nr:hypothetical protein [Euryarchaeota archaeon]
MLGDTDRKPKVTPMGISQVTPLGIFSWRTGNQRGLFQVLRLGNAKALGMGNDLLLEIGCQ